MSLQVSQTERFSEAVHRLEQLCAFSGSAKVFWTSCLSILAGVAGAQVAVLLRAGEEESEGWQRVLSWPGDQLRDEAAQRFLGIAEDVAEACTVQGGARRGWETLGAPGRPSWCLGVRLTTTDEEVWVATFLLLTAPDQVAEESLRRLRLLAHLPMLYSLQEQAGRSELAVSHFASVMDLMAKLNEQRRYVATVMAFCNELAARHTCDRVSLGWVHGTSVELQALSGSERFERRSEAVRAIEAIMEEALDQEEVIVWPEPDDQHVVSREHERFSEARKMKFLCSVPLHLDGEPVAVLTCERSREPFADVEVRLLALCCDMAVRRLGELQRTDRWFGARWMTSAKEGAAKLLGPEHTGTKLCAVAGVIAAAFLFFGRLDYRVEAPFALRAEDAAYLSAPFAGYLSEVHVEVGSEVKTSEPMAALDQRDLLLEEANAIADEARYLREAEKAAGADKPAEMRIAQALAEQARARLEIVRFRRQHAVIRSPFSGVVVEGDLKRRIGAPVKQGDILFRIARLEELTVECSVSEADMHTLKEGGRGEIAFASLPKESFPVVIKRIEPIAQPKESGNVFVVHCVADGVSAGWWRPGMSGVAKLSAGRRSPAWILTHRTVDFLRMHLWW